MSKIIFNKGNGIARDMAILSIIFSVFTATPFALQADYEMDLQRLDAEIARLTTEKQAKYGELEKCVKSVKGFKIAGITTLGLTAVGIGVNIGMAVKQSSLTKQIEAKDKEIEQKKKEIKQKEEESKRNAEKKDNSGKTINGQSAVKMQTEQSVFTGENAKVDCEKSIADKDKKMCVEEPAGSGKWIVKNIEENAEENKEHTSALEALCVAGSNPAINLTTDKGWSGGWVQCTENTEACKVAKGKETTVGGMTYYMTNKEGNCYVKSGASATAPRNGEVRSPYTEQGSAYTGEGTKEQCEDFLKGKDRTDLQCTKNSNNTWSVTTKLSGVTIIAKRLKQGDPCLADTLVRLNAKAGTYVANPKKAGTWLCAVSQCMDGYKLPENSAAGTACAKNPSQKQPGPKPASRTLTRTDAENIFQAGLGTFCPAQAGEKETSAKISCADTGKPNFFNCKIVRFFDNGTKCEVICNNHELYMDGNDLRNRGVCNNRTYSWQEDPKEPEWERIASLPSGPLVAPEPKLVIPTAPLTSLPAGGNDPRQNAERDPEEPDWKQIKSLPLEPLVAPEPKLVIPTAPLTLEQHVKARVKALDGRIDSYESYIKENNAEISRLDKELKSVVGPKMKEWTALNNAGRKEEAAAFLEKLNERKEEIRAEKTELEEANKDLQADIAEAKIDKKQVQAVPGLQKQEEERRKKEEEERVAAVRISQFQSGCAGAGGVYSLDGKNHLCRLPHGIEFPKESDIRGLCNNMGAEPDIKSSGGLKDAYCVLKL